MNKNNRKFYMAVSFAAIFVLTGIFYSSFYSISKLENDESEIVITYADNISPAHKYLIAMFNKMNKGKIRIEPIDLPFSKFSTNERKELITRSLRSKSKKMDIFAVDLIWTARFAKWAEPLDKYVTSKETSLILKQPLESCKFNNQLYALPIYLDIGTLFYRKDLIKQIPNYKDFENKLLSGISWNEFIDSRKYFNLDKNQFYIFPADNYEGLVCSYMEILYNFSNDFKTSDMLNIKSDANKKTFNFIHSMFHSKFLTPIDVAEFNENDCYEYFAKNNAVFVRGWASSERDFFPLFNSQNIDTLIGKAPIPQLNDKKSISVLGGWNLMISKYSEHKNEAFQFIKFVIDIESQKKMYEIGNYLPIISSLYSNKTFLEENPDIETYKLFLTSGIHRPLIENYTKLSDVISYYLNKVIKDEIKIDDAIEKTEETIKTGRIIIR